MAGLCLPDASLAHFTLEDIEECALCSHCRNRFDDADHAPKLLACEHHFCLSCVRSAPGARCPRCSKRTELPPGGASELPTVAVALAIAQHVASEDAAHARFLASLTPTELKRLTARRRDLVRRVLDITTELKTQLEAELADPTGLLSECEQALLEPHSEAMQKYRLEDLVCGADMPHNFELIRHAQAEMEAAEAPPQPLEHPDPVLFVANYCTAELYRQRSLAPGGTGISGVSSVSNSTVGSPLLRSPSVYPLYYFSFEVNGSPFGRIVIEVHEDIAPRMAHNFAKLATSEADVGYRGCHVFECWENESVITGDLDSLYDARGGHAALEERHFMPDDTTMLSVRGTVGMRRAQKRHGSRGLVGSQFRIVLKEMRAFSANFACVGEGLDLVDRLSRMGDGSGKPQNTIVIANCGKLN